MKRKYFLLSVIFIFIALSLFAGTGYHQTRLTGALWNAGHILLFALIAYFALYDTSFFRGKKPSVSLLVLTVVTLILGFAMEFVQWVFHSGKPDVADVARDLLGAAIPVVFGKTLIKREKLRYIFQTILVILLSVQLFPAAIAAVDEFKAWREFPVLSDFESELELSRWEGEAKFGLSDKHVYHGNRSLHIILKPSLYSGVALVFFPSDWSEYRFFEFHVFNPESKPVLLICRINDAAHRLNDYRYSDRFHKEIEITPGWNHITIDLKNVQTAPKTRLMDMKQIKYMKLFSVRLPERKEVWLDYVRLRN